MILIATMSIWSLSRALENKSFWLITQELRVGDVYSLHEYALAGMDCPLSGSYKNHIHVCHFLLGNGRLHET